MKMPIPSSMQHRKLFVLGSIALILLGASFAIPEIMDHGRHELRVSAGPDGPRRHRVAEFLREKAALNGLDIRLNPNAGSVECLNQLNAGTLDAAIVSNGVVIPDHTKIRVLGAIQVESLHILLRNELTESGKPLAEALRGKRVNLGAPGSTEAMLSRELLSFAKLKVPTAQGPGEIIPMELGELQLIRMANSILAADVNARPAMISELPDCLMILASMPSTAIQLLVEAANYRIVPLPISRAFLLDNILDEQPGKAALDREYLESSRVAANSYVAAASQPPIDCDTVGVRLLVVARKDAPSRAIRLLMRTLHEGEFSLRIQTKTARELATPFAIHPVAEAYLDRDKPLAIRETMESVTKAFSLFGVLSAAGLTCYGLLRKKKPRKPSDYFSAIRQVDMIARGAAADESAPMKPDEFILYLDDRLLRLRQDLIGDICEGNLKGDQVIANILALLKDTRANLQRLREGKGAGLMEEANTSPRIERRAA